MKINPQYIINGAKPIGRLEEFFRYKIPLICYAPVSYLLSLINKWSAPKRDFKYKVSLCLIFKDEGPYLKEWLEYHLLIGVDHFYLYNNNSEDNFREVLAPYVEKGIVTLIDFPEQYAQIKAYRDCYEKTKNETEWLGYIDADEYVNLIKHNSIKDLLDSVKLYPSLYLNWHMFGTSGHLEENYNQLTIERYTQAWEYLSRTGKGFINNNYPIHEVTVHFHSSKLYGLPVLGVLANKNLMHSIHYIISNGVGEIAYLNHYWSRSYEFYKYKAFVKSDVASMALQNSKKLPGNFVFSELQNKSKDFSIQRWLIFLKEKMHTQ